MHAADDLECAVAPRKAQTSPGEIDLTHDVGAHHSLAETHVKALDDTMVTATLGIELEELALKMWPESPCGYGFCAIRRGDTHSDHAAVAAARRLHGEAPSMHATIIKYFVRNDTISAAIHDAALPGMLVAVTSERGKPLLLRGDTGGGKDAV